MKKDKLVARVARCWKRQCPAEFKKPCWARRKMLSAPGVNLYGYVFSEIGLGQAARLVADAIATQPLPLNIVRRELPGRESIDAFHDRVFPPAPFSTNVTVVGAPELAQLRGEICRQQFNIVYPFWELEKLPKKLVDYCKEFDSFWAPSQFIFDCLKAEQSQPVHLVKQPVQLPNANPTLGLNGDPLRILTYFDFDSFPARKNPEAAVNAFRAAFPTKQADVSLTVKTRGKADHGRRAWLEKQAAQDARIKIIDKTLNDFEMSALMRDHDIFLSLHRSEGFGLGCAEALIAGRAVVATDYGGTTDFINAETGYPVAWDSIELREGDYIGWEGAHWADPSIDHAAAILLRIYDDPEAARLKTKQGLDLLRREHSFEVIGRRIVEALKNDGVPYSRNEALLGI